MQRTVATLTKQTTNGLSTWSFVVCDGLHIAFGGTTNRCRTFRTMRQMRDCMQSFIFRYGYVADIKSAPKPVKKVNPVQSLTRPDTELPEDLQRDLWSLPSVPSEPELALQDGTPVVVETPLF
jgi:hypothetical protein